MAESEAFSAAIALAELVDLPIMIVHVSHAEGAAAIRHARARGSRSTARPARSTCSSRRRTSTARPRGREVDGSARPARAARPGGALAGLALGDLQAFSSDHAPYPLRRVRQAAAGPAATFKDIANGMPGIELPPAAALRRDGDARAAWARRSSWSSPRPTRRRSTISTRARAPSPSAPMPTSPSGIPTAR